MRKNKMLTEQELVERLSVICKERGGKVKLCNNTGVTLSTLCEVLAGKRSISEAMAENLGYRRHMMFEKL